MKNITYGRQFIDNKDINEVQKSLKMDLITTGAYVSKFENLIQKNLKVKHALSCTSGTAALHLAFLAIGLKKNDIVVMPAVNFIASYNLCKQIGAKIYFADVDPSTGQMTRETILNCIKQYKIKKLKLLITMYLGGYPEGIKDFYYLKKKFKCFLIEDACHALGAKYYYNNRMYLVGQCSHSDICVFSLHPLKTITSGEGGIICTNKNSLYKKLAQTRSHGIIRNKKNHWEYEIKEPGFNYRLSDINCALGYSQFKKINKFVDYRKKISNYYKKLFKNSNFVKFPSYDSRNKPSYHLFIINLIFKKNQNKNNFLSYLKKNKISAQFHYIPIYKFKVSNNKKRLPFSDLYFETSISVPIHYNLKIKDVKRIVKVINQYYDID